MSACDILRKNQINGTGGLLYPINSNSKNRVRVRVRLLDVEAGKISIFMNEPLRND